MSCPACGAPAPAGARYCSSCAAPLAAAGGEAELPTELAPDSGLPPATGASPPSGGAGPSHGRGADEARFLPGTVLAGRFRIVSVLGRGGMGEVYRADDLKLGQTVALKFLPEAVAGDREWLDRFLAEVNVARQVSHPGVCRVYDVGEVEGHHFLSMEYIDGEDLGSLLRRIGRLPQDKALQIARQICAALAACHDRGVLHRDLKPANVMIDGRGAARLTDFGLAAAAGEVSGADVSSGTPAYMSPEQLEGREVTARSDLYALGLVLYQVFTGQPAFSAASAAEVSRLHRESTPANPSSVVSSLDPAVERAILRCLEKDPARRPSSALAVSAALPGGDPLAAALAAGETPSPEMVAAAGEEGSLTPRAAIALLAAFLALTAGFVALGGRFQVTSAIPLERSREVLADRGAELLRALGAQESSADRASAFHYDGDVRSYAQGLPEGTDRFALLAPGRPAILYFWQRQSPRGLVPIRNYFTQAAWFDPPMDVAGMAGVKLDTRGLLIEYYRVPDQKPEQNEPAGDSPRQPDWGVLFAAAGLDPEGFESAEPRWRPPFFADLRAAWTGSLPEPPGSEVRIEAASLAGEPIYFRLIGPWSRAERQELSARTTGNRVRQLISLLLLLATLAIGGWMTRRNLRAGRGDRRGATRLALFVLTLQAVVWVTWSHHPGGLNDEFSMFVYTIGISMFNCAFLWLLYIALEPYVRRHRPDSIISWSRLLAGRFRDPLVGRDLLMGTVAGAAVSWLVVAEIPLGGWLEGLEALPQLVWYDALHGPRFALGRLLLAVSDSFIGGMFVIFLWFLLLRILRLKWLVGLLLGSLMALSFMGPGELSWTGAGLAAAIAVVFLVVLVRHGLLSLIASLATGTILSNLPVTGVGAWYSFGVWLTLAALAALAVFAFRASLGGRPIFSESLLADS